MHSKRGGIVIKITKNIILSAILVILIISGAVTFTLFFTPLYYADIDTLNITELSGKSREVLINNYNTVVKYMLFFNPSELSFPDFVMSAEGKIHFEEVKRIFLVIQIALIASAVIGVPWAIKKARLKDFSFLIITGISSLALPIIIGCVFAADFDSAFTGFHQLFFNNDYWIFDPLKDPIITALPEDFFMHCLILIVSIVIGLGILLTTIYGIKKSKLKKQF